MTVSPIREIVKRFSVSGKRFFNSFWLGSDLSDFTFDILDLIETYAEASAMRLPEYADTVDKKETLDSFCFNHKRRNYVKRLFHHCPS